MSDQFVLMHLMTAKLCHDIATPLGALGLGLEMAIGSEKIDNDTQDLLLTSSETAKLRLKVYRALLTASSNSPTFSDVKQIITDLCHNSKVRLAFDIKAAMLPDGLFCRLVLGATFMIVEALHKGGVLSIHIKPSPSDESMELMLVSEGEMVQLRPGHMETLKGEQPLKDQSSRTILPFYLKMMVAQYQKKIDCEMESPHKLCLAIC
jgi:histidine phosphotransferase ChpT